MSTLLAARVFYPRQSIDCHGRVDGFRSTSVTWRQLAARLRQSPANSVVHHWNFRAALAPSRSTGSVPTSAPSWPHLHGRGEVPTAKRTAMRRTRIVAAAVAAALVTVGWQVPAAAAGGPNLALGKAASASSVNGGFGAGNLNDGNQGSYWESSGALPQWAQVDLGASTSIDQVVLKLPGRLGRPHPDADRAGQHRRHQRSARSRRRPGYAFNPASGNAVTINFTATHHPVRAGQHHRQHRLGRGAAVRAGGLRHRPAAAPATSPRAGPPRRAATPTSTTPATSSTATRAPTGRASTTRSRSGCRSTSARRRASTGSC